jgi:hypothetical protein
MLPAVDAGQPPARMAHGRFTYRRPSRLIQTPRPSPKTCSIEPLRAAVARWHSPRSATPLAPCTRCTNGDPQIPIAPAEPGAPRPATPFPGGFRTLALGACGGAPAGPASETRHILDRPAPSLTVSYSTQQRSTRKLQIARSRIDAIGPSRQSTNSRYQITPTDR